MQQAAQPRRRNFRQNALAKIPEISFAAGLQIIEREGIKRLEEAFRNDLIGYGEDHPVIPPEILEPVLYVTVYNVCQQPGHDNALKLYEYHNEYIESFLKKYVIPALETAFETQDADGFLTRFLQKENIHRVMIKTFDQVFSFLDATAHHATPQRMLISYKSEELYQEFVILGTKDNVGRVITQMLNQDRLNKEMVDRLLLKSVIGLIIYYGFGLMNIYEEVIELSFLASSVLFYKEVLKSDLINEATLNYFTRVEHIMDDELRRVRHFLHPQTEARLLTALNFTLLQEPLPVLMERKEDGFDQMITLNATSELLRIFQLYKRADKSCMEYLASLYQKHIFEKGIGLWNARQEDVENDPAFIKSVIQFLHYFNGICQKSFENNKLFLLACKEAYISTINFVAGKFTMVEILSVFVDTLQKPQSTAVGSQKLTEPEIENLLYETISIFSHLKAKDVYVELYRVHLSRRLLNSRSASYEMEMNYVSKLKINCGAQFTSKLEGMLFDLDLSDDKEIINE